MEPSTSAKDTSEAKGVKRKRSFDTNPSGENLGSEELAENLTENGKKAPIKTVKLKKKRKFVFNTDTVLQKRCRKFRFLNQQIPKPRKPKIGQPEQVEPQNNDIGKKHKSHFARCDGNGNIILMHKLYQKSDLFFNDEKKCNYESSKKFDLNFHIVDEIALEGLDGITLEAFWKRLKYVFPNYITKNMAERIWRLICNNKHINIYILKEPREELIFFDRCKYLDVDSGLFVEPFIEFNDIYPMASVNGTEVRGSCSTFDTRKENNGVRKFSMDKALKLYDQKLVFVADQSLREKALINDETDPNIELLDVEYCILERIGRSRDQGEVTQGKMPLVSDGKKVYHNRKILVNHSLITHQNFCLKSLSLQQTISGGLVHLSRFYNKRKTKQVVIMERIANLLKTRPNNQIELTEFRQIFGRNIAIIKLLKTADFRKFFKIDTYRYRMLYPNASQHEYLHKNKQRERQIKVLRMVDPCANVTAIMDAKENKEIQFENLNVLSRHKYINCEYLRDIFLYILSTGHVGVTLQEINDHVGMDFYSVRMAVRKLMMRNVIDCNKIDLGRQQSLKYYAKCFSSNYHINTQPKNYELSSETLSRVLQGYTNKTNDNSINYYYEPEPEETLPIQTQFKLNFEPFCCTAFLTEIVDPTSDELTIYDIVIKGRDKLLLIESNLFAHYISEWDEFLLKREDFSKGISLFQTGFGKIIYDFLTSIRTNVCIEADNSLVFNLENLKPDTKIAGNFQTHRIFQKKNFKNPHSNSVYIDQIGKIYLFQAMLIESHRPNQVIDKLKNIFERLMLSEGYKKRFDNVKVEPKIQLEISSNVVMEKFMGSQPYLEYSEEEDGILLEVFASTKPENLKSGLMQNDDNQTQRYLNRANTILKRVYREQVVNDFFLYKDIRKEEDNEGYDKKVCKKSIVSILAKLVSDGYIKIYKVVMTEKNMSRTQCFVCLHKTDISHPKIKSTIEQMKLKFFLGRVQHQKTIKIKKKESPFSTNDVKESIQELKQLTSAKQDLTYRIDRNKGQAYGYSPKFVRMRVLHEHLFYVIRELEESEPLTSRQVFELCKNMKIKITQNEILELPQIFRNEISWKMFIPALPEHNWLKGWALVCDIILRMPLSVFVKLYNISYDIPELEIYLNHPIKKHYLLKHLPATIRNILFHKRKYLHSIYENICNLCYVGLLQLGPRNFKEKDQLFIYLNIRATLYDTCTSQPGYNLIEDKPYKEIFFEFKTSSDVEIYWSEMLRISMNTQLGKRKILDGQCVTIEECSSKPAMMETLRAKTFDEAVLNDTGRIPGDRRGGAGIDSSLWSFVKRNWVWPGQKKSAQVASSKKEKFDLALPQPIQYDLLVKGGAVERKIYLRKGTKIKSVKSVVVKKHSKKKFVRKIIAPKSRKVREYYDAVDKSIMRANPVIRVEWDEEEDQLLRYCRAAARFLCPEYKKQFIPYNIIRDVLHRVYPKSRNKTARAIQRRIYVLLTNDETIKIMENNIENFSNSDTISKFFDQVHNRYKNEVKYSESQIYICFVYLMSYILKHRKEVELLLLGYFATFDFFSDSNISEFESILQCDNQNSVIYTDPKNIEDVTKDTIRAVVHCSMACKKNSVGWTFHLSQIYNKFKDELIRQTVMNLKKEQFFVINKSYEGKSLDNSWPTPLKFSHVYNLMKSSTYTNEMFQEAFSVFVKKLEADLESQNFIVCNEINTFWEAISFIFEIPEMGIILNPEIDDHSEVIEELAKRFRLYLDKIYEKKNTGKNFGTTKDQDPSKELELDIEKIKSKVRHLIFRVPYLLEGDLELYFKKMLESNNNLEINNFIYLMIVDLKKFTETSNTTEEIRKFVEDVESSVEGGDKLLKNLSKVVFAIQTLHQLHNFDSDLEVAFGIWENDIWDEVRGRSEETSEVVKYNKYYACGMEECVKRAQEGDFPSIEEIKEGMMAEVGCGDDRKIPHITDLIMLLNEGRFPELDTDSDIEKLKEHFVMQFPKLDQFVIEDLEQMKESDATKKIMDCSKVETVKKATENIVKPPQEYEILKYVREQNGTDEDFRVVESLIDFIKDKRELGVSGPELKRRFINETNLDLAKLMSFLNEIGMILRAGVASVIYVHYEFQSEWLTETFVLSPEEKEVFGSKEKHEMKKLKTFIGQKLDSTNLRKVQLKPWTKLDGSLNNELFNEWLCLFLSRCIDLPNIPFSVLCEHFHYIKPVDVYFLLEILQGLGCVKIYMFNGVENNISSTRRVVEECIATCLDNFEEMFVKPTNVSGLCFGSFLDNFELFTC